MTVACERVTPAPMLTAVVRLLWRVVVTGNGTSLSVLGQAASGTLVAMTVGYGDLPMMALVGFIVVTACLGGVLPSFRLSIQDELSFQHPSRSHGWDDQQTHIRRSVFRVPTPRS